MRDLQKSSTRCVREADFSPVVHRGLARRGQQLSRRSRVRVARRRNIASCAPRFPRYVTRLPRPGRSTRSHAVSKRVLTAISSRDPQLATVAPPEESAHVRVHRFEGRKEHPARSPRCGRRHVSRPVAHCDRGPRVVPCLVTRPWWPTTTSRALAKPDELSHAHPLARRSARSRPSGAARSVRHTLETSARATLDSDTSTTRA